MALKACPDTLQLTFSFLDPLSLARCTPNKYWKKIAYQEKLWKVIAERDYVGITADFQKTCREINSNRHTAITLHQAIETYFQHTALGTNSIFRCFFEDGSRFSIQIKAKPLAPYSLTMNCSAPANSFGTSAREIHVVGPAEYRLSSSMDQINNGFIRISTYRDYKIILSMTSMKNHWYFETGRRFIDDRIRKKCIEIFEAQERTRTRNLVCASVLGIILFTAGICSTDHQSIQNDFCKVGLVMIVTIAFFSVLELNPNFSG